MTTNIITILNDGETFTDANGVNIVRLDDATTVEDAEQALDDGSYDNIASLAVENGVLVIYINDASGVPVVVVDERTKESN